MAHSRPLARPLDDPALTVVGSAPPPGPYSARPTAPPSGVPSLSWFCIQRLVPFVDQVHTAAVRLNYRDDTAPLLHNVIPATIDLLDPRLWATLVQLYDGLPPWLATYPIPLHDIHLPLLQRIPSTPSFSLVTLLELPGCPLLTDQSVVHLKYLRSLAAFDASDTRLSPYAFKALASTLQPSDLPHLLCRGPWPLRILSLRRCTLIDNSVFSHLAAFPLLSVLDLRGTDCTPDEDVPSCYHPSHDPALYYPTRLADALLALSSRCSGYLHSSPNVYTLHIKAIDYSPSFRPLKSTVAPENSFFVFSPSEASSRAKSRARSSMPSASTSARKITEVSGAMAHSSWAGAENDHKPTRIQSEMQSKTWTDDVSSDAAFSEPPAKRRRLSTDDNSLRQSEEVASEEAAKEQQFKASLFYQLPPDRQPKPRNAVHPHSGYSADTYWARERAFKPGRYDKSLMLYRDPPPWTALEVCVKDIAASLAKRELAACRKRTEEVAAVNRSGIKAAMHELQVQDVARWQENKRNGTALESRTLLPTTTVESKNPFRKQRPVDGIRENPSISAPLSTSSSLIAKGSSKPLRPISQVKIPELSKEHVLALAKEAKSSHKTASSHLLNGVEKKSRSSERKRAFDWGGWSSSAR